jgi:hypothetical protein
MLLFRDSPPSVRAVAEKNLQRMLDPNNSEHKFPDRFGGGNVSKTFLFRDSLPSVQAVSREKKKYDRRKADNRAATLSEIPITFNYVCWFQTISKRAFSAFSGGGRLQGLAAPAGGEALRAVPGGEGPRGLHSHGQHCGRLQPLLPGVPRCYKRGAAGQDAAAGAVGSPFTLTSVCPPSLMLSLPDSGSSQPCSYFVHSEIACVKRSERYFSRPGTAVC